MWENICLYLIIKISRGKMNKHETFHDLLSTFVYFRGIWYVFIPTLAHSF